MTRSVQRGWRTKFKGNTPRITISSISPVQGGSACCVVAICLTDSSRPPHDAGQAVRRPVGHLEPVSGGSVEQPPELRVEHEAAPSVTHDLSATVFVSGKPTSDFWQRIFETGRTPAGQHVLPSGINLMDMLKPSTEARSWLRPAAVFYRIFYRTGRNRSSLMDARFSMTNRETPDQTARADSATPTNTPSTRVQVPPRPTTTCRHRRRLCRIERPVGDDDEHEREAERPSPVPSRTPPRAPTSGRSHRRVRRRGASCPTRGGGSRRSRARGGGRARSAGGARR